MSISTTSKPGQRAFFLFDHGLASTMAGEFLFLFAHAGFDIRCSLAPGAEKWLPPEPIRLLTGHAALPYGQAPAWAGSGGNGVAIGILSNPATWLDWISHAGPGGLGGQGGPWFFFVPEGLEASALAILEGFPGTFGLHRLPANPGELGACYEKAFAGIVRFLQTRKRLQGRSVSIIHEVPPVFAGVLDRTPLWVDTLRRQLLLQGFSEHTGPGPADLMLRTYPGPFPVARKKQGEFTLSFTLQHLPPPEKGISVQFLTEGSLNPGLKKHAADRYLPIVRQADGSMRVFTPHEERLFPDLTEAPALTRLAEFLAESVLTCA